MPEASLLGPWVRRFLMEYLVGERNLAGNTQRSYRDTLWLRSRSLQLCGIQHNNCTTIPAIQ